MLKVLTKSNGVERRDGTPGFGVSGLKARKRHVYCIRHTLKDTSVIRARHFEPTIHYVPNKREAARSIAHAATAPPSRVCGMIDNCRWELTQLTVRVSMN